MLGALKKIISIFFGGRRDKALQVTVSVPVYRGTIWLLVLGTAALVAFLQKLGLTYFPIFLILWIGNMLLTGSIIKANRKTDLDFTSMEGMRNILRKAQEKSRFLGYLAEALAVPVLVIWSGADHFIIFFEERLSSRKMKILTFVLVSACNMAIWTLVFIKGADGFWDLISRIH